MTWGAWLISEWRPVLYMYWLWFYIGSEYAFNVYNYSTADSMNFATSVMATFGYTVSPPREAVRQHRAFHAPPRLVNRASPD